MFLKFFIVLTFTDLGMVQLLFPILAKIYFQKIMTIVPIIGIFVEDGLKENVIGGINTRQGRVLTFLILWTLLSIPFGIWPGGSFRFITESYWKTIVVFFLVIAFTAKREDFDTVIWTYILASGLLSILTILSPPGRGGRIAIMPDIYDANDTALQFLLVLPFVIWKYLSGKGRGKLLSGVISLTLVIGIVETKSRGGFLGLVAVLTAILFQGRRSGHFGFLKMVFSFCLVGIIVALFGSNEYLDRMSTIFEPEKNYNFSSSTGRIEIWKRGLDMMVTHPLTGVGIMGFSSADGRLYSEEGAKWSAAHNSFVQIGAELGLPGLIAFCYLVGSSMGRMRRIACQENLKDRFWKVTSHSIFAAWAGFVVSGFFLSAAYTSSFYFLLALSISFMSMAASNTADSQAEA